MGCPRSERPPRQRRRGPCGVERAEASEGLGDPARPVLHVDDVVVADKDGELGEGVRRGGRGRRGCPRRRAGNDEGTQKP